MKVQGMEIIGRTSTEMLPVMQSETKQRALVSKATGTGMPALLMRVR